ncbi:hypothetical protein HK097_000736 [Rhizophlyctis rosea]|uniref:Uncharacterized protein n=1 Tax=Rhizophlyctis rosea TaxID=64517 RepID=A0AAD5SHP2_9FUNG|nr:hypothetical protein HK097_000736 [Rhizophlyctis rosea]
MSEEIQSARYVISLAQDVLATSLCTLYQMHAISAAERTRRDEQAKQIVATRETCKLWLQFFPFVNDDIECDDLAETLPATMDTLLPKVKACVEAIAKLRDTDS